MSAAKPEQQRVLFADSADTDTPVDERDPVTRMPGIDALCVCGRERQCAWPWCPRPSLARSRP